MGKRIHLFLLALAIGVIQGAAQVTTVRGIVTTEEDGEPVIGASVIVKGTSLGTEWTPAISHPAANLLH